MSEQSFLLPYGKSALLAFLEKLPTGFKWKVTISRYKRTRSDQQNKALFGVAYKAIREATGNDVDDLHTMFCGEYFGWVDVEVMGQRKRKPVRTTTTNENGKREVMSTTDFADFYNFVQMKAAEFGIRVPDPNEQPMEDAA